MSSRSPTEDELIRDVEAGLNGKHSKLESDGANLRDRDLGDGEAQPPPPKDDQDDAKNTNQPLISGLPFYVLIASVTLGVLLIAFNATAVGTVRVIPPRFNICFCLPFFTLGDPCDNE